MKQSAEEAALVGHVDKGKAFWPATPYARGLYVAQNAYSYTRAAETVWKISRSISHTS
jgi:hypothetical protein